MESPTKCKTIKSFLGREYVVVSSKGHIKDLPKSELGIDINNNFTPKYIKIKGKAKIVQEIKKICRNSNKVYLASDPDREGEAIAQHIAEELNSSGPQIKRVLFHEITPDYVKKALQNPGVINPNLVDAHKTRRVLDRIVGYFTSPFLWKVLKSGLSAGRVQTVALRLICEREKEIKSFIPTPYWVVFADFETEKGANFKGELVRIDGIFRRVTTEEELVRLKNFLQFGARFTVTHFRITNPEKIPSPPFITSSFIQEASKRLNFPAKKAMQIAQELYEGVALPQGRIGLITYMRTDSVRVSESALEELREYIEGKFGAEYLNPEIRKFRDKKGSQSGHEAIRPTKVKIEPDSIKEFLIPEQYKVYKLIFERYVASQMASAKYKSKEVILESTGLEFKAEEIAPVFLGYQLLTDEVTQRGNVPDLKVGDVVVLKDVVYDKRMTEPLPRYTEASLIKKLENNGIGRPSTYAHIIQTLFERRYVTKENGKILPTDLGFEVYKIIIPRFSNIFEVSFTAWMEEELDRVESGRKVWQDVIREFYGPFLVSLKNAKAEADKIKELTQQKVEKICPKCQRPLVLRWGKYGRFLACSGFPECKYSENYEIKKSDKSCPKCGLPLVVKYGKFGEFLACAGYPSCKYTENLTYDVPCPVCGGEMIIFTNQKGRLYKCKQCGFSSFYPPVKEKCPDCGKGMVQKKTKIFCPFCKSKK